MYVCVVNIPYVIAGHPPSEGRVGEGKSEGRIGFF